MVHYTKNLYLPPRFKPINAILDLSGSKSIANRVLLIAALSNGVSIIHNVPTMAEDVTVMVDALKQLGISINIIAVADNTHHEPNSHSASYEIVGCCGRFPVKQAIINCGGSGTVARFLTAVLAFMPQSDYQLIGVGHLLERPISDLVDSLNHCGACITYLQNDGVLPLKILGFKHSTGKNNLLIVDNMAADSANISTDDILSFMSVKVKGGISSQFVSGLLIGVACVLQNHSMVIPFIEIIADELVSKPYVNMTIALLTMFGAKIDTDQTKNSQLPSIKYLIYCKQLSSCEYTIEPDASSASYFMAMACVNGSDITINNLSHNSLQGDVQFAYILSKMGAIVEYLSTKIRINSIEISKLNSIEVDMQDMPDSAMTLAVLALFANGTTIIHGISTWVAKETNRASAMYTELTKLGAKVILTNNSISITPPIQITPNIAIDTYNDHRMAMCFSLVALANIPVIINDYKCVNKTFANYFDVLYTLCL